MRQVEAACTIWLKSLYTQTVVHPNLLQNPILIDVTPVDDRTIYLKSLHGLVLDQALGHPILILTEPLNMLSDQNRFKNPKPPPSQSGPS